MCKTLSLAIGSDHAGFAYKQSMLQDLSKHLIKITDFGTFSIDAVDYPDFAHAVSYSIQQQIHQYGILLCGSANGMAMTANKYTQIRAAICWNTDTALLARKHNNANILCIPTRFITCQEALNMVYVFLETSFEQNRHLHRVAKIDALLT